MEVIHLIKNKTPKKRTKLEASCPLKIKSPKIKRVKSKKTCPIESKTLKSKGTLKKTNSNDKKCLSG
jgi:hypothetical protein